MIQKDSPGNQRNIKIIKTQKSFIICINIIKSIRFKMQGRYSKLGQYLWQNHKYRRYFCCQSQSKELHKSYFDSKQRKLKEKHLIKYCHEKQLIDLDLHMKNLVPNFFTSKLPLKYSDQIQSQDKTINYVSNSFIHLDIPILSRPELQLETSLRRFNSPYVRVGRIMQAMDSIAGIVGYRHCYGSFDINKKNPFILVTGSVDSINLFDEIDTLHDISLEGYVNFVGKTSMQIEISLYQNNAMKANALFTMISRDASRPSKGYPCPALSLQHLSQKQLNKATRRLELAKSNIVRRKKQMQQSYQKNPPKPEDIAILHQFFLKHKKDYYQKDKGITIQSTIVQNTLLMHLQERNVHCKIFGGFLMREMLETAWIAGNRFVGGQKFMIQDITNIYFMAPVEIGTELRITAKVTYSKFNILVIAVEAETYNNQLKLQTLCCHLNVFIKTEQSQCDELYPLSYQNGILYLSSKNSFEDIFNY